MVLQVSASEVSQCSPLSCSVEEGNMGDNVQQIRLVKSRGQGETHPVCGATSELSPASRGRRGAAGTSRGVAGPQLVKATLSLSSVAPVRGSLKCIQFLPLPAPAPQ